MKRPVVKYTFYADSLAGLEVTVEVCAHTFIEAKKRILKCIYMGKTGKYLQKCVDLDGWGRIK